MTLLTVVNIGSIILFVKNISIESEGFYNEFISATELERQVLNFEEIRIVIRNNKMTHNIVAIIIHEKHQVMQA